MRKYNDNSGKQKGTMRLNGCSPEPAKTAVPTPTVRKQQHNVSMTWVNYKVSLSWNTQGLVTAGPLWFSKIDILGAQRRLKRLNHECPWETASGSASPVAAILIYCSWSHHWHSGFKCACSYSIVLSVATAHKPIIRGNPQAHSGFPVFSRSASNSWGLHAIQLYIQVEFFQQVQELLLAFLQGHPADWIPAAQVRSMWLSRSSDRNWCPTMASVLRFVCPLVILTYGKSQCLIDKVYR